MRFSTLRLIAILLRLLEMNAPSATPLSLRGFPRDDTTNRFIAAMGRSYGE